MLSRIARLAARLGHARARHLLIACVACLGIVVALGAASLIITLRQQALAEAGRDLKNLALVLSQETDRSFRAVELVQLGLIEHMRETGIDTPAAFASRMSSFEAHENLRERIAGQPGVDALALIDVHGRMLNISRSWPVQPIDVSDRTFFKALTADPGPTSFISEPLLNRVNGAWTILYARKFVARDGGLIGIVSSGLQLDGIEQLFSGIKLDNDATFGLFRSDGVLLARYPHMALKIGQSYAGPDAFGRTINALDGGVIRRPSLIDGADRLIAPHSVAHYPLVVTATNTVRAALVGWRHQAHVLGGGTVAMELIILAIVLLGVRHLRGYELLEAADAAKVKAEAALLIAEERERGAHELQTQSARFDTALSNMLQGLMMFDQDDKLLVANRRFARLFGLPDDALKSGMTYQEMTECVIAIGNVTAGDMEGVRHWRSDQINRNSLLASTYELSDGRTFMISHQPMESGWLATYEDITERRAAESRIAHMAHHDALTNLPNRVLFHQKLEQALALAGRGREMALLCLDLDQFKAVNDTLGHPIGDALLQAVAQRLAERTRETDTVARLGGDEFAVVQSPIDKPSEATNFAQRLIDLLDEPFEVAGHQIVIGTSIGIAFAPQDGLDPDQLLKNADLALYRAKVDGRGIYRLFHAEMDAQMQARRLLELDLRQALRVGQLEVFYQPLVDVQTGTVSGLEALLRWRHPERGIIPPSNFIPLAEEIGLIVPIGEFVLQQACATAASWPGTPRIAINLSPAQFKSRNLLSAVAAALRNSCLPADRLELEVTETVMLQDTDTTLATLHQLRALGVHIAMDDFGTGYSSLSYLRRFPFDRIKIDQSFIRELGKTRDCGAIVRAVATLSNELGIETTAEGVETQDQLDALTLAGCTEVQGYLFSPAVPAIEVPALLRSIGASLMTAA
jgi:diguanylate cyclase (GGDEF)-like protein